MAVTTSCELRVGIGDLQRAVTHVAKHAEKAKPGDKQPITVRVRLIAEASRLLVVATDGRTSALGIVEVLADSRKKRFAKDDGPFVVDLRPRHARELGDAIVPNRVDKEDVGEATLSLALDVVTITDVSGKYPNTSHTVPVIEQEATMTLDGTDHLGYPDVASTLATAAREAASIHKPLRPPPGGVLARFEAAAADYGPLLFEPVGPADAGAWLVWARDGGFIGQMENRHQDDAERRRELSARFRMLRDLGLMTAEEVMAEELKAGPVPEPSDDDGFYDADQDDDADQDEG